MSTNSFSPTTQSVRRLREWLARQGAPEAQLTALAGDASPRRYYRVSVPGGDSSVLMDARREPQSVAPFLMAAQDLSAGGLRVPRVLARGDSEKLVWLEDAGAVSFLDRVRALRRAPDTSERANRTDGEVAGLYRLAIDEIIKIHALPCAHLRHFDPALLEAEMNLFRDWFLRRELGEDNFDQGWNDSWRAMQKALTASATSQPQVWVHRDYHSRNLMMPGDGRPVLLDFQDAVRGAGCYDLVSLLRDYYCPLPASLLRRLQGYFLSTAPAYANMRHDEFVRCFDLLATQRHLKVIGIFTRLKHRDGKPGFLADIPRAWHYLREVSSFYPELRWLDKLIKRERVRRWMAQARAPAGAAALAAPAD